MELIKNIVGAEPDKQVKSNYFKVSEKNEKGKTVPYPASNPIHIAKVVGAELTKHKNFMGFDEDGVMLKMEEDGVEKDWFIPKYVSDKNNKNYGKFDYKFEAFADIEIGDMVEVEFMEKGKFGFTRIDKVGAKVNVDDIPVIEEGEIDPKSIPF